MARELRQASRSASRGPARMPRASHTHGALAGSSVASGAALSPSDSTLSSLRVGAEFCYAGTACRCSLMEQLECRVESLQPQR